MPAIRSLIVSLPFLGLAACAATAPAPANNYWQHSAGSRVDFAGDNQTCSSRASRVSPTGRAEVGHAGGATIPNNRIDRPPEKWVSAVAERAYMECMRDLGWTPRAR